MRRAALAFLLFASLAVADSCPNCRKEVEKSWRFCPGCGKDLPDLRKAVEDAASEAEKKKRDLLVSLRALRAACEDAGDGERAKRVQDQIEKLEGTPLTAEGVAPAAGAEAYAGEAAAGFKLRLEHRAELGKRCGATPESEATVEAGLRWLARHQGAAGGWASAHFDTRCAGGKCGGVGYDEYDAGVTGLAVLAFLGAGITPRSEKSWRDEITGRKVVAGEVVRRGIEWLAASLDAQGCAGGRHGAKYMYNHAIATLALAEAYGMTGAEAVKGPAQTAIRFLVEAQNPGRGWRYSKNCGDSDTSVTSWAVAALRAAETAGLGLSRKSYDGAKAWFVEVTDEAYYKVGYTAKGTGKVVVQGHNEDWDNHETLTAAAMVGRFRIDATRQDPALEGGAKLLVADLPQWSGKKIDFYYWFHGTEALFVFDGVDGKYWRAWFGALKDALVSNQATPDDGCESGSWNPEADRWGFEGGRVSTTALGVLALETGYRDARTFGEPAEKKKGK
jgi:hypothetical protein